MEKNIGKEYANRAQREAFLKDNCDAVEERGYMKAYSPEQLQGHKEKLANTSIEIAEIEVELKMAKERYKARLKPLKEAREQIIANIKSKSEYVREICYKFTDQDAKITGYYNAEGDLIEERPATADEMQPTIFAMTRKTGTND